MRQLTNPMAPPALAGIPDGSPDRMIDADFSYVYDTTPILTALEERTGQQVPIDTDADFVVRGIVLAAATGAFLVKFFDSSGYYLSSDYVHSANLSQNPAAPTPVFPELIIPAGGRIGIDIRNLLNGTNDVQILFRGVKRYRLPQ